MADLKKFEEELRAEHASLKEGFETAQAVAEEAWAVAEKRAAALTEFRSKYLRVLKALDAGAVRVKGESVTIKASDVGTLKVEG